MARPRLLDLGCCGGGAGHGYGQAGFDVTGLDIAPHPNHPGPFILADALIFMMALATGNTYAGYALCDFDAFHASMPCQRWAQATLGQRRAGKHYPDLITPLRPLLAATGKPWVMENVPAAPLRADLDLCGCMFGLELPGRAQLYRPRRFEMSFPPPPQPPHAPHRLPAVSICGHGTPAWQRERTGHIRVADWRQVMGIGWTNRAELAEAIPWAYTAYAGKFLMEAI